MFALLLVLFYVKCTSSVTITNKKNALCKNLSKIWGIIYVKRMIPMIHNYTSNISREQFELIREDLENA
ncbi:hypothetical protein Q0N88_29065, partial [Bacillus thuringiensis]